MKKSTTLLLSIFLLITANVGFSQHDQKLDERNPQAMMKATFLFQFAKQSNWIESVSSESFIIAVYGNTDVYNHLSEKYATQPIGNQTLKIIEIKSIAQLSEASIVFIDKSKMKDFNAIKQHFHNQNTMLVTETKGALKKGSMINFLLIDSELKIEINNKEAQIKKISIGILLIKWAINNN